MGRIEVLLWRASLAEVLDNTPARNTPIKIHLDTAYFNR